MDVIVTLAEGQHFLGVGALLNSAVKWGFKGKFIAGYRNKSRLPKHVIQAMESGALENHGIEVVLKELHTKLHFANYKPSLMKQCFDEWPEVERMAYFDPDIVMACPWSFLATWMDLGVALCADVNWHMPWDHPIRRQWTDVLKKDGLAARNESQYYFNSGYLGVTRERRVVLDLWERYLHYCGTSSTPLDGKGDIGTWRTSKRWDPFMTPDQDSLNIAVIASEHPVASLGPDAMGFVYGDLCLPHAIGRRKPWERKYLTRALNGFGPRNVDRIFWNLVAEPIQVFMPWEIKQKRIHIKIAGAINRFYNRK